MPFEIPLFDIYFNSCFSLLWVFTAFYRSLCYQTIPARWKPVTDQFRIDWLIDLSITLLCDLNMLLVFYCVCNAALAARKTSVRPSNARIVAKRKELMSTFLEDHRSKIDHPSFPIRRMAGGDVPFYLIFW